MGYRLINDERTVYQDVYKVMDIQSPQFAIDFEIITSTTELSKLGYQFVEEVPPF